MKTVRALFRWPGVLMDLAVIFSGGLVVGTGLVQLAAGIGPISPSLLVVFGSLVAAGGVRGAVRSTRSVQWQLANPGLVAAAARFRAVIKTLDMYPVVYANREEGVILTRHTGRRRLVRWDLISRTDSAHAEEVRRAVEVVPVAVLMGDGFIVAGPSRVVRTVVGSRVRWSEDGGMEKVGDVSPPRSRRLPAAMRRGRFREIAAREVLATEEELRQLCVQMAGAKPIGVAPKD